MTSSEIPPVFINCRDRLACVQALLAWLEQAGCREIYLIDNDSRYEPLLDYYQRSPHQVIYLGRNVGRLSFFAIDELQQLARGRSFVYTDPDVVPIAECPADAFSYWADLLARYPEIDKAGPGLKIDDLPRSYAHRSRVPRWENQFWKHEVEPGVFRAPIDTTFALYRPGTVTFSFAALRTGHPYVARHLAWYANSRHPSADDQFYDGRLSRGTPDSPDTSYWSGKSLHPFLVEKTSSWVELRRLRALAALRTRFGGMLQR